MRSKISNGGNDTHLERELEKVESQPYQKANISLLKNLFYQILRILLKGQNLDEVAGDFSNRRRHFLALFAFLHLIPWCSMGIFYLLGGKQYFNGWFILLIPAVFMVGSILIVYLMQAGLWFAWNRGQFRARKLILIKNLLIIYCLTPIPWALFPLKLLDLGLKQPIFLVNLLVSSLLFLKSFYYKPRYFRQVDLLIWGVLSGSIFYYFHGQVFFLASWLVKIFHL